MKKSVPISNNFCPETLFLYGTYREDGAANFGTFSWFSYYWDGQMGAMACIGGAKLTRDRINATRIFSANLVTEELLPLADHFGTTEGYSPDKMNVDVAVEAGRVLHVPALTKSPWIFELEVDRSIALDGAELYLCTIRNTLADERLGDERLTVEERLNLIKPVHGASGEYFSWNGHPLGAWGEPKKTVRRR